ncbi:MAG TPA: PQQ-dependent sugar dehydrogenase, partial [Chitinophagaceae bacterium]|nr:PQQ-dependent sugar dehydrogenase [Chitinophagaceae bacterium]
MNKSYLLMAAGALFLASCGAQTSNQSESAGNAKSGPDSATHPPVETKAANSAYKPAFAGQTRIGGVKTTTPYAGTVLTSDLENPWGIVALPDGRLLITEKGGTMRIATTTGTLSAQITGLPPVNSDGQGG